MGRREIGAASPLHETAPGWEIEMMIHKMGGKLNRTGYRKVKSPFWRKAGVACMALVLAKAGGFSLSVQAAPATLKAPDATVYEQANEGSNAVGSLVEGNSFEYIGDVTAEDGSVWHQITTANGATGYIRGDRELELREEEPGPQGQEGQNEPEGQDAPAENGGDTTPAENGPGENGPTEGGQGVGENTGEAAGGTDEEMPEDDGTEETPEEGSGEDEEDPGDGDGMVAAGNMRNDQTKKYVLDVSAKVKERESFGEINTDIEGVKRKKAGADMTLMIGMSVLCFCAWAVIVCLSRMRRLKWGTDGEEVPDPGRRRVQRKIEKKKHNQKRKAKKYKKL